jgi:predicted secreted Zn-dependent protease
MARGYESRFAAPRGADTKAMKEIRSFSRLYEVNLNYRELRLIYDLTKDQIEKDVKHDSEASRKRARALERMMRTLAPTFKLSTAHYMITGDEALTEHDEKHYETEPEPEAQKELL